MLEYPPAYGELLLLTLLSILLVMSIPFCLNLNAVSQEIANDKTIGVEITRDGAAPAFVNVTIKANISAT